MKKEIAIFGMGCFWGPQKIFDNNPGVLKTEVGYMGGKEEKKSYSYEEICSHLTGHAEVIKIEYNPEKITYSNFLNIFWKNHNPTQGNRQGFDIGDNYRSVIFYKTEKQKELAEKSLKKEQEKIKKKITTQIVKAGKFYIAELYHQKYLEKQGKEICNI